MVDVCALWSAVKTASTDLLTLLLAVSKRNYLNTWTPAIYDRASSLVNSGA